MKESYGEGIAIHPGPESCVASRKAAIEALTGAPAGRVLSCEIFAFGVSTSFNKAEDNINGRVFRERSENPAGSARLVLGGRQLGLQAFQRRVATHHLDAGPR